MSSIKCEIGRFAIVVQMAKKCIKKHATCAKLLFCLFKVLLFWCHCCHCILKSLLFIYYDVLLMNQGHNQEISRGMHNFPSPPAPTPTLLQLFHALYIKLAAYLHADVSSISFINMLQFLHATKEVGGICIQASLPLSAFSCLFSEHTLPMITCCFSGNQHLGMKNEKAVVSEKSYFKETSRLK